MAYQSLALDISTLLDNGLEKLPYSLLVSSKSNR